MRLPHVEGRCECLITVFTSVEVLIAEGAETAVVLQTLEYFEVSASASNPLRVSTSSAHLCRIAGYFSI